MSCRDDPSFGDDWPTTKVLVAVAEANRPGEGPVRGFITLHDM